MGGGFGGKESQATPWAAIAALAARVTGRPCKIRLDRDDDMVDDRQAARFPGRLAVGFDDHGVIAGVEMDLCARCGCSADSQPGRRGPHHVPRRQRLFPARVRDCPARRLKTNTVSNTAFRGFGGPQGMMAIERVIDAIAWQLGPGSARCAQGQSLRRRAATSRPTACRSRITTSRCGSSRSWSVIATIAPGAQEIAAFNAHSPILKRGIALTPVKFGISFTLTHLNQAGALVHVYQDGSVHLNHGGTEMGQGLFRRSRRWSPRSSASGIDACGSPRPRPTRSPTPRRRRLPPEPTSTAWPRSIAARQIRERMADVAAEMFERRGRRGRVPRRPRVRRQSRAIGFGELADEGARRPACNCRRPASTRRRRWSGTGRGCKGGRSSISPMARPAREVVDRYADRRDTRSLRVDILHDVGRSLNPAIDIGQIEGAFIQGMGWLTTEELVYDERGPPAHPCAVDLQDPGRLRRAGRFPGQLFRRREPRGDDLPLQGGGRAAADAGDFRVRRDRGRACMPSAPGVPCRWMRRRRRKRC